MPNHTFGRTFERDILPHFLSARPRRQWFYRISIGVLLLVRSTDVEAQRRVLRATTAARIDVQSVDALGARSLSATDASVLSNLRQTISAYEFSRLAREWTLTQPIALSFGDALVPLPDSGQAAAESDVSDTEFALPEAYLMEILGVTHSLEVFLSARALRYDHAEREFVGQVDIWVQDRFDLGAKGGLIDSIAVQIIGDVEAVVPNRASIGHIGIPTTQVAVHESEPLDSVAILIVTTERPRGYPLKIPVRPALEIRAGADTIDGWGIEATDLTVSVKGSSWVPETRVEILAQPGSLNPSTVIVSSSNSARVKLRSSRLGPATVEATAGTLGRGSTSIYYSVPLRFIVAAILGALVGIVLSGARKTRGRKLTSVLSVAVRGLLAGIVVVLAYLLLGVNLLPVELPSHSIYNEGLVFIVAVLGAFGWSRGVLTIQKWRATP